MITEPRPFPPAVDVLVVGARCAGAATGLLAARAGLDVLVVDRAAPGRDTLSTHALMRAGVVQLHRFGVLDGVVAAGTPAVRTTVFHYGDASVPIAVKPGDGIDALYAPRRTVLDPLLVDAARSVGADVRFGTSLRQLQRGRAGRVTGAVVTDGSGRRHEVSARIVIGADGVHSTVARLAGAPVVRQGRAASAFAYTYADSIDPGAFHWYFRPGASAGVIATNDGQACVFAGLPAASFDHVIRPDVPGGFRSVLAAAAPDVAEVLAGAGPVRAFPGHPGFVRQAWGPGWALVGDAGYFKDPLTAHGISDALIDAEHLAAAVTEVTAGGDEWAALDAYGRAREERVEAMAPVAEAAASYGWDLESIVPIHLAMSEAMNAEVAAIRALDATPAVA